jgi:hypothetical protein
MDMKYHTPDWPRYAKALDLHLAGATLAAIGGELGVSGERARQMLVIAKWRLAFRLFEGVSRMQPEIKHSYGTAAVCDDCWNKREQARGGEHKAVRMREPQEESCHFCAQPTKSGIYIRVQLA